MVRGEEVQEPKEIKEAMIEFYSNCTQNLNCGGPPLTWKDVLQSLWKKMSGSRPHTQEEVVQIIKQCQKA